MRKETSHITHTHTRTRTHTHTYTHTHTHTQTHTHICTAPLTRSDVVCGKLFSSATYITHTRGQVSYVENCSAAYFTDAHAVEDRGQTTQPRHNDLCQQKTDNPFPSTIYVNRRQNTHTHTHKHARTQSGTHARTHTHTRARAR